MLSPCLLTEQKGETLELAFPNHVTRLENEESIKRGVPRLSFIQQLFSTSHTWGPRGHTSRN